MTNTRTAFLLVLLLGAASAISLHSDGAMNGADALGVAAARGRCVTTSPPAALTAWTTGSLAAVGRLAAPDAGIFPLVHLASGLLLALAAALAARLAARFVPHPTAALAVGIAVGGALLFGGDTGRLGLQAGPTSLLLLLLTGSASAFLAERPRPVLGALLLGAALAEYPWVLVLLPAFGAMAMGGTLRRPVEEGTRHLAGAAGGLMAGFASVFLPLAFAAGEPLVLFGNAHSPADALAIWWGRPAADFRFAGPGSWPGGLVEILRALWRGLGPLGIALAVLGKWSLFRGETHRLRPFLLAGGTCALALLFGDPGHPGVLRALTAWSGLFLLAPAAATLVRRFSANPDSRLAHHLPPAVAIAMCGTLLATQFHHLDGRVEPGVEWAEDSFLHVPEDALLLTTNPIHLALAADGLRPDLDVIHADRPSTLRANRSGRPVHAPPIRTGRVLKPSFLHELIGLNGGVRPIAMDPSLYFRPSTWTEVLGNRWAALPWGVGFTIHPAADPIDPEYPQKASALWAARSAAPDRPRPSSLRSGLSIREYHARSALQHGSIYQQRNLPRSAEQSYMMAISLDAYHPTLCAFKLAGLFHEERMLESALTVLEGRIHDEEPEAWRAHKLRASLLLKLDRREEGVAAMRHAMSTLPPDNTTERAVMERVVKVARSGGALPGRGAEPLAR